MGKQGSRGVRTQLVAWGGLLAVVALVSGCAGDTPAPVVSATSQAVQPPCGGTPGAGGTLRVPALRTTDGVRLAALETGNGPRGVVLVPEAGSRGECGWLSYATVLAQHGYRVLLFDDRCQGGSDCPAAAGDPDADTSAALAALRRDGATREVLVGASAGGAEALAFAAEPHPGLRAVAALSPDELDRPLRSAPLVRIPALLAVASDDPYVSVAELRRLFTRLGTPASSRSLTVLPPGSGHGWDLLAAPASATFRAQLLAFLARNLD